jgi:hypothetical protein
VAFYYGCQEPIDLISQTSKQELESGREACIGADTFTKRLNPREGFVYSQFGFPMEECLEGVGFSLLRK